MQRFYHTHRLEDNALAAVLNLCALLGIKTPRAVTASYVKAHPYYPSFAAISDALEACDLETLAVHLPTLQHDVVPLPAIAHLHADHDCFVALRHIDKDTVEYVDASRGMMREPLEQFQRKYTGNILLVAANEATHDRVATPGPSHTATTPWLKYGKYFLIAAAVLFMMRWRGFAPADIICRVLYFISLVSAAGISMLLVAFQHGAAGNLHTRFCGQGRSGGCRDVLNSKAARVAGISLADIGVVYFSGTLIVFLLGDIAGLWQVFAGYLWLVSLVALPFAIFSVLYQKFRVSSWCPLCLTVAALLVMQAIVLTIYAPPVTFRFDTTLMFLSGYLLAPGLWLITRPLYERAVQADVFKQTALSLKQNPAIISTLLRDQNDIPPVVLEHDIVLGNPQAVFTITLVINPQCGPCKAVYGQMEKLLSRFRTRLRVVIRFVAESERAAQLARYFIQLSLKDMRHAETALSTWFATATLPPAHTTDAANNTAAEYAGRIYTQHVNWAARAGITTTPLCIINTKPLPRQLELADLEIYLKEVLSSATGQRSPGRSAAPRVSHNTAFKPIQATAEDLF